MRSDRLYLLDIIEAADRIDVHLAERDRQRFLAHVTRQAAVLHELTVIGEAASRLPPRPEATQRDPEEPIHHPHPRSRSLGREDGELLAEGEVLDQKVGPRRSETSEPTQGQRDSGEHRDRMEGDGSGVNDAKGPASRYDPPVCKPFSFNADDVLARETCQG